MAYDSFDKKGRRRKDRRRFTYETAMLEQEEEEMIKAGKKHGTDNSDGTGYRAGHSRRHK